jgi:hypothetical protein
MSMRRQTKLSLISGIALLLGAASIWLWGTSGHDVQDIGRADEVAVAASQPRGSVVTPPSVALEVASAPSDPMGWKRELLSAQTQSTADTLRLAFGWQPDAVRKVIEESMRPGAGESVRLAAFHVSSACLSIRSPPPQFSPGTSPADINAATEARRKIQLVCETAADRQTDYARINQDSLALFTSQSSVAGGRVELNRQSVPEQHAAVATELRSQFESYGPAALMWLSSGLLGTLEAAAADPTRSARLAPSLRDPHSIGIALEIAQCLASKPCGQDSLAVLSLCAHGLMCADSVQEALLLGAPSPQLTATVLSQAKDIIESIKSKSFERIGLGG